MFSFKKITLYFEECWSPRSCHPTPLDFFLWGHVKSLVYKNKMKGLSVVAITVYHLKVPTRQLGNPLDLNATWVPIVCQSTQKVISWQLVQMAPNFRWCKKWNITNIKGNLSSQLVYQFLDNSGFTKTVWMISEFLTVFQIPKFRELRIS